MTRPAGEIRADLEHPHTRALLQVHSTSVGDGPIGRLLRDVEPLLDRLEAVERERDRILAASECNHLAKIEQFHRAEAALARIAAVEAELEREKLRRIDVSNTLWSHIGELHQDLAGAALAASPTPTGPTVEIGGQVMTQAQYYAAQRPLLAPRDRPATPTGPETAPEPKRCAGTLGDRPPWMSPGQFSPCRCELLDGHDGECQCEHTRPAIPTKPDREVTP